MLALLGDGRQLFRRLLRGGLALPRGLLAGGALRLAPGLLVGAGGLGVDLRLGGELFLAELLGLQAAKRARVVQLAEAATLLDAPEQVAFEEDLFPMPLFQLFRAGDHPLGGAVEELQVTCDLRLATNDHAETLLFSVDRGDARGPGFGDGIGDGVGGDFGNVVAHGRAPVDWVERHVYLL